MGSTQPLPRARPFEGGRREGGREGEVSKWWKIRRAKLWVVTREWKEGGREGGKEGGREGTNLEVDGVVGVGLELVLDMDFVGNCWGVHA